MKKCYRHIFLSPPALIVQVCACKPAGKGAGCTGTYSTLSTMSGHRANNKQGTAICLNTKKKFQKAKGNLFSFFALSSHRTSFLEHGRIIIHSSRQSCTHRKIVLSRYFSTNCMHMQICLYANFNLSRPKECSSKRQEFQHEGFNTIL